MSRSQACCILPPNPFLREWVMGTPGSGTLPLDPDSAFGALHTLKAFNGTDTDNRDTWGTGLFAPVPTGVHAVRLAADSPRDGDSQFGGGAGAEKSALKFAPVRKKRALPSWAVKKKPSFLSSNSDDDDDDDDADDDDEYTGGRNATPPPPVSPKASKGSKAAGVRGVQAIRKHQRQSGGGVDDASSECSEYTEIDRTGASMVPLGLPLNGTSAMEQVRKREKDREEGKREREGPRTMCVGVFVL